MPVLTPFDPEPYIYDRERMERLPSIFDVGEDPRDPVKEAFLALFRQDAPAGTTEQAKVDLLDFGKRRAGRIAADAGSIGRKKAKKSR